MKIQYVVIQSNKRYCYVRRLGGTQYWVPLRTDDPRIAAKLSRGITSILETMVPKTASDALLLAKAYMSSPKGSSKPARRSIPVSLKITCAKAYVGGQTCRSIAKEYGVCRTSLLYWATQYTANHFTLDNAVAFSRNPVILRTGEKK